MKMGDSVDNVVQTLTSTIGFAMHVVLNWRKASISLILLLVSLAGYANPKAGDPHGTEPVKRVINAHVVVVNETKNRTPYVGTVALEILQHGQPLFMIPKETDGKGNVKFGSIDVHPFSYRLHADLDGQHYMTNEIALTDDQTVADVTLPIGPGAPEFLAQPTEPEPTGGMPSSGHGHASGEGQWVKQQIIAIVLSLFVIIVLALQWKKKR